MTAPFPDKIPDLFDAWNVVNPDGNRSPTCGMFDHKQWKNGPHCRDYFFLSENFLQQIQTVSVNTDTNASDHQPIRLTLKVWNVTLGFHLLTTIIIGCSVLHHSRIHRSAINYYVSCTPHVFFRYSKSEFIFFRDYRVLSVALYSHFRIVFPGSNS